MKVDRDKAALKKTNDADDGFMVATAAERVSFIWELTAELWSLKDKDCAERRLQRDVTNLIRQRG